MVSRGGASSSSALVVALCLLLQLALLQQQGAAEPLVPAMFVFGDSTVDVGNNNYLNLTSDCKADYPRYGVDYRDQAPTGRFSNGYNLADQLAQLLGFAESPPPFESLPEERRVPQMMSTGINFASGGSGISYDTGHKLCDDVLVKLPLTEQLGRLWTLAQISANGTAADHISKSLFLISVGSNDIFEWADDLRSNHNDTQFLEDFVSSYSWNLQKLYDIGARKFCVVSPSLVGCSPSQRLIANQTNKLDKFKCYATANNLSIQVYPRIASMLQDLSAKLPGMNYSLGDSASMAEWVLNKTSNPVANRFKVLDKSCCGDGAFGANPCNLSVPLCKDRNSYLFWDRYHPTEAASNITATVLFGDHGNFVHPINVQQLAAAPSHK